MNDRTNSCPSSDGSPDSKQPTTSASPSAGSTSKQNPATSTSTDSGHAPAGSQSKISTSSSSPTSRRTKGPTRAEKITAAVVAVVAIAGTFTGGFAVGRAAASNSTAAQQPPAAAQAQPEQQTGPVYAPLNATQATVGQIVTHLGYPDIPAACAGGITWTCGADFWISDYGLIPGSGSTVRVYYTPSTSATAVSPGVDPGIAADAAADPQALARAILADMPASVEEVGVFGVASSGHADRAGKTQ